ncbi:glutaredoxin family protein [Prochlorococcus sp. MIT 1307]|uniref:glutaredoxin family protein n=1 Tax=Prochlorococcus sp. MIT 1307 TaxID=3096219 RepID=UPI002A7541A5|nr:glutaredoxin family protein [Prochlorococcus sp. MIT 1307]
MSDLFLILYSRKGCCLCEELARRLTCLPLEELIPPIKLRVIDIDAADTPKELCARYDTQVPVMLLGTSDLKKMVELPRVSPRMNSEGLFLWLQKIITKTMGSD